MNEQRLSPEISAALAAGSTFLVPSAQRQAAVRAAWARQQRAAGRTWWDTPRVLTFTQFAQQRLGDQWAADSLPDRLLPPGAEWARLREWRREGGGTAEARALLNSVRTLTDWRMPRSRSALGGSPEGDLLLEALITLDGMSREQGRKPLREWLGDLTPPQEGLAIADVSALPALQRETAQRLGARVIAGDAPDAGVARVAIATARDDDHEIDLIAAWCRAQLEAQPARRLLVVDSRLRQRRREYERVLSQTLSPSEWLAGEARAFSTFFSIEGGQPLTDFPLIAHALLCLRLLTSELRFDEVALWLRMPFLDSDDLFAGAAVEAVIREGHRLEYSAAVLAGSLDRSPCEPARALAGRLRQALTLLGGERRDAPDWAQRIVAALRALGWPGSRPLRSDEQQTLTRWYALLDEYSALGAWLARGLATDAVATLGELARERNFDPASVDAPVTLTESHDDPIVRYDAIWVAGLDAAQWPPAPRPDVFIPLRLQVAAGMPGASAAAQARRARASLQMWRAATPELVCSWAELDGDARRTHSPLLARLPGTVEYVAAGPPPSLARRLCAPRLEPIEDARGIAVDTAVPVRGGVKPLELQAQCAFRAYGEMRLGAERLEAPAPGLDARDRGRLLHKALELVWKKLDPTFLTVTDLDPKLLRPAIADSVQAAIAHVFRGHVPAELRAAVEREATRLERLIEALFREESLRTTTFHVESLESRRAVDIAGGNFEVVIDRIDVLQGGGYAILDYKSGDPGALRWDGERLRNPQLLAYLQAEQGRDVQALANVALTRGRARFIGKASRPRLLPGVRGMTGLDPAKVPAEKIDSAWQAELARWRACLHELAARYLAGEAATEPAADVCRNCHLTVLCRRVELAAAGLSEGEPS